MSQLVLVVRIEMGTEMRRIVVLSMLVFLASCENEKVHSRFDFEISAEEYAKIKRIPERAETRKEAALKFFSERTQIANYLLDGPLKENVGVQVLAIEAKNKIAIDTYLNDYVEAEFSEEKAREFYEANIDEFVHHAYHVDQILMRIPGTANEADLESAMASVAEISKRIANGEEFSRLASGYSEGRSSAGGGQLSVISTRNGDPAILEALAGMSEGEVSKPVRTALGLQILRLESKEELTIEYEKVRHKIAYQLKQELKEQELGRISKLALGMN
jgi:hypothetical protein